MLHALIADAQTRLNQARRELKTAVLDFDLPDDKLLEMRGAARTVYDELAALDQKLLKKGLFSFLKFW